MRARFEVGMPPSVDAPSSETAEPSTRRETAVLGGGCFWCTEAVFRELRGVQRVESGYAGGSVPNPSYEEVCTGNTGHAEVVRVEFDPTELDYRDLLRIFFTVHDPTTRNRQGADVGTQYRSVVLYSDDEQRRVAEEVVREVTDAKIWRKPIVTEIEPLSAFYPAEEYHRDYFRQNPERAYCQLVIAPKVVKFRKKYAERLKAAPAAAAV
jgi:peptide-methionine (S)-S-oxide reductase